MRPRSCARARRAMRPQIEAGAEAPLDHVERQGHLRDVGAVPRLRGDLVQRLQGHGHINLALTRVATPDGGNLRVRCDGRPLETDQGKD